MFSANYNSKSKFTNTDEQIKEASDSHALSQGLMKMMMMMTCECELL